MKEYPKTPELDKIILCKDKSQLIGEFLEWLETKKRYCICEEDENGYHAIQIHYDIDKLLLDYFEIDHQKAENEKEEILNYIRTVNLWPEDIRVT